MGASLYSLYMLLFIFFYDQGTYLLDNHSKGRFFYFFWESICNLLNICYNGTCDEK